MIVHTVMTCGISELIDKNIEAEIEIMKCLFRFCNNDWGDMCDSDKQLNEEALKTGEGRLFAAYNLKNADKKIWIIQDDAAGAVETYRTIMFPDEY